MSMSPKISHIPIETLETLAEWFDNPNQSPSIFLSEGRTPAMVLREIIAKLKKIEHHRGMGDE